MSTENSHVRDAGTSDFLKDGPDGRDRGFLAGGKSPGLRPAARQPPDD